MSFVEGKKCDQLFQIVHGLMEIVYFYILKKYVLIIHCYIFEALFLKLTMIRKYSEQGNCKRSTYKMV